MNKTTSRRPVRSIQNIRSIVKILFVALLLALSFAAVTPHAAITAEAASRKSVSLKISKKKLTLQPGKKATVKATVRAVWTTSNPNVVIVTGKGKKAALKAVGNGSAIVTAKAGGKNAKCRVTVKSVLSLQSVAAVAPGKKLTLKASGAFAKKARWASSNKAVATVKGRGKKATVTAKKAGKTVITARYGNFKVKCTVTVTKNQATRAAIEAEAIGIPHIHKWVPVKTQVKVGTKTVVDEPEWDEPISEYHEICSQCGIDFVKTYPELNKQEFIDVMESHIKAEALRGEGSGNYGTWVQVGTKHHDAKTHEEPVYDTVTTGYVCAICGAKQ